MPRRTDRDDVLEDLAAAEKILRKVVEAVEPYTDVNVCVAEGSLRVAVMAVTDARDRLGDSL